MDCEALPGSQPAFSFSQGWVLPVVGRVWAHPLALGKPSLFFPDLRVLVSKPPILCLRSCSQTYLKRNPCVADFQTSLHLDSVTLSYIYKLGNLDACACALSNKRAVDPEFLVLVPVPSQQAELTFLPHLLIVKQIFPSRQKMEW